MKESSHYLHVTGGRLRIKVGQVRNSKEVAFKIEHLLENVPGIKSAKANPLTGNVLVLFDSKLIRHEDIVKVIRKNGYFEEQKIQRRSSKVTSTKRVLTQKHATNLVADIVLQKAVELTLRRALVALL